MKKNDFLLIVSVLIILSAIALQVKQLANKKTKEDGANIVDISQDVSNDISDDDYIVGADRDEHGCIASAGYSWCEPKAKCLRIWEEECILEDADTYSRPRIHSPKPEELVSSPLYIEGEARGTWFFEANMPIALLDSDNNVIAESYAEAKEDWMTEEFIPFSASLDYSTLSDTAYLVIKKSNPSELHQYDDQIKIPLKLN